MQLKAFKLPELYRDVSAGVLVALVGIPQCLAYSMLAGLPPMYGLATAAIPGLIAAVLGRSAYVTVGPTNTTGLIILSALSPFALQSHTVLLTAMAVLTLLAGLVRLLIAFSRSERIFDFIPEAVLAGFATGAAIIIALMQLDEFCGLSFARVNSALDQFLHLVSADWYLISIPALSVSISVLSLILIGRQYVPALPMPLLLLLVFLVLVHYFHWEWLEQLVLLGEFTLVSEGWPTGELPIAQVELFQQLMLPAFAVAFIGSLELIVILRKYHQGEHLTAEIKGQGIGNLIGSFTSAFPASTSLTRSVLLQQAGAKTRLAPVVAALALLPLLFWGGGIIEKIPQAVIAAILVCVAISMINPQQIKQMLTGNSETRFLFLLTLSTTLLLKFHEAILIGVMAGIGLFLYQASRPRLKLYGINQSQLTAYQNDSEVLLEISGSLFFAAAKGLPNRVSALIMRTPKTVILEMSHTHQMRVAGCQALKQIVSSLNAKGCEVWISGLSERQKSLVLSVMPDLPITERWVIQKQLLEHGPD